MRILKNNYLIKKYSLITLLSGVRYFECKYDTYDCETSEHISKGELVWKDNEGIHRADNY